MGVKPCENIVVSKTFIWSVINNLEKVEDFNSRWESQFPGKPLTHGYGGIHVLIEAALWGKIAFIPYLYEKEKTLLNLYQSQKIKTYFGCVKAAGIRSIVSWLILIQYKPTYDRRIAALSRAQICLYFLGLVLGDTYGWTALNSAAYENEVEAAKVLLELNADPNLSSTSDWVIHKQDSLEVLHAFPRGTTCLDIALSCVESIAMAVLLLKFNAQTNGIADDRRLCLELRK